MVKFVLKKLWLSSTGRTISFYDVATDKKGFIRVADYKEYDDDIEALEGATLVSSKYEIKGITYDFQEFQITLKGKKDDKLKIQEIKSSKPSIKTTYKKENDIMEESSTGLTYKIKEEEFSLSHDSYSPFREGIYIDSYLSDIIVESKGFFLSRKTTKLEAEISVLQNFINRSLSSESFIEGIPSSIIATLILEIMKHNITDCQEFYFALPEILFECIEDTKKELKALIDSFGKIMKNDVSVIKDWINYFTFKKSKNNEIKISDENEQLLVLEIIETSDVGNTPSFLSTNFVEYNNLIKQKKTMDALLKKAFYNEQTKIAEFKSEQIETINNILVKKTNVLAVLKTGFGKSLIYQFISLLQPTIVVAIFPINALIDDQLNSLQNDYGFSFVLSNTQIKEAMNKITHKELGKKRLFILSPERLANPLVQKTLKEFSNFIGLMVFDEAHCISEWGHDFRPGYLSSRYLVEKIKKANTNTKILGLTATAAPHIQKDIMRILGIERIGLINIADNSGLYRPELEYHLNNVSVEGKFKKDIAESFINMMHKTTNYKPGIDLGIFFFLKSGGKYSEPSAGLNANYVFNSIASEHPRKKIGLYTGSLKQKQENGEIIKITNIGDLEDADFIFATKAFGMGINLKRCNYVCLAQLPASLEDLYQQAGRVGRMGQKSKVDILYTNNHLIDPTDTKSDYNFFLDNYVDKRNVIPEMVKMLLEEIIDNDFNAMKIDVVKIAKEKSYLLSNPYKNDEIEDHLMFAIAHLMMEFNVIEYFNVEYSGGFGIKYINVFISSDVKSKDNIKNILTNVNKKYSLNNNSKSISDSIDIFYDWYFNKLQEDKVIGFNILRKRLQSLEGKSDGNMTHEITNILIEYYKTKSDSVDVNVQKTFEMLKDGATQKEVNEFIKSFIENDTQDYNEAFSRYSIHDDYKNIVATILYLSHGVEPLVMSTDALLSSKPQDQMILNSKLEYITEIYLENLISDELKEKILDTLSGTDYINAVIYKEKIKMLKSIFGRNNEN